MNEKLRYVLRSAVKSAKALLMVLFHSLVYHKQYYEQY